MCTCKYAVKERGKLLKAPDAALLPRDKGAFVTPDHHDCHRIVTC